MNSPYSGRPNRAYWRSGVAERAPLDPGDLYQPRFEVGMSTRVATAGSCFAQHVGRALRGAGRDVIDAEPLPDAVPDSVATGFGYRLYSARYGNIYTARQLLQLVREAEGQVTPADPVWTRDGRYYDAQRPSVEPGGLDSAESVQAHRAGHLAAIRSILRQADLFVFTFGLTECWMHRDSGTVFPTAPGTLAGTYDPEHYVFKNFDAIEVLEDFEAFRSLAKTINPGLRFLVTVSPVPLTATASGQHVEVATSYSKSVLRAVTGMLYARHEDIDYFPSYEVITALNTRGAYYDANQRNVNARGVATAMQMFLGAHRLDTTGRGGAVQARNGNTGKAADIVCEDALLEAFAQ
ncbi:GSCFA domain-containing protein [Pararhodobacter marinus]|uniref:GSCFA domain-containing protein n=1 Tax=Pararhodobacter marinus TaxID=2184063 RepID=UPI0035184ADF